MKTTLSEIRSFDPCQDRWENGLQHLDPLPAADEPFPVTRMLETNGLDDTLWLLGRKGEQQLLVRFACDCAGRAVERYWEPEYPDDRRPQEAIEAARRWVESPTEENRDKAGQAAKAAVYATRAAYYDAAAYSASAAEAADAAADAAYAAAAVADDYAAACAAAAADDATEAYADHQERTWQIEHLRKLLDHAGALRSGATNGRAL